MERVVVGMSGGVDSSLTACLLKEAGYEVVGVTLKLWPCAEVDGGFTRPDACCSPSETIDARSVAQVAGLRHYVIDMEAEFRAAVVDNFIAGYARGETPNPCIRCNESIKFGDLYKQAQRLGADTVGTGHYARTVEIDGRWCLGVPADRNKDQTYFLFSLTQDQLRAARFPLGGMTKDMVRAMAAERQLVTAHKRESQDICFVGPEGTAGFLREHLPEAFKPGPIEHIDGTVLGEHNGMAAYTVGQRKGLGVAYTEPLYVVRLDMERNTVILGPREAQMVGEARLRDCTWHLGPLPAEGRKHWVRNRYRMRPVEAHITPDGDNGAIVRYAEPQPAPSAGQACVAYDEAEQLCFGGGWFY